MRVFLAGVLLVIGCAEPSAPSSGYIVLGSSSSTVTVAWPSFDGATSYTIERGTSDADLAPIATLPGSARSFLDKGLAVHTEYAYRFTVTQSGGDTVEPILHARTTDDEVLVTGVPVPLGDPIVQTIDASGGAVEVPAMHATLTLPAGAVPDGTSVTVQPIASPYPDDDAPGVMFVTSADLAQPAAITFAYDELDTPDNLAIAVQQDDGSWVSQPRVVDETARTVTVAVGEASSAGRRARSAPIRLHAAVMFQATFVFPRRATVKPHDTLQLTPVGLFSDDPCDDPDTVTECNVLTGLGVLTGQISVSDFLRPAHRKVRVLANHAAGADRTWTVNLAIGGNGEVGTVLESGDVGATYTAPGARPADNPVAVRFTSVDTKTHRGVTPRPSLIKIHDPGSLRVTMTHRDTMSSVCGTSGFADASDRVTFAITLDDQLRYHVEAIHNEPTKLSDIRPNGDIPMTVTTDPEVFTMTSGTVMDDPDSVGLVAVYGTLDTGGCFFPSENGGTTFPNQTLDTGLGFEIINSPTRGPIATGMPRNWNITVELVED